MTDTAAPQPGTPGPAGHRRLYIVLAAGAAALIALAVAIFLFASSAAGDKAADYNDAYAAWEDKERPVLLRATAKVPAGTYTQDEAWTTKSIARQQKGCDAVIDSRKQIRRAVDRLPALDRNGLLGKVSSEHRDASDASARRERVVRSYEKAASSALGQIERDCRWNIAYNKASSRSSKYFVKATKYALQPGDTEPGGIFCPNIARQPCVSSIAKRRHTYADLRLKSTKLFRSTALTSFSSKDCRRTSVGPACRVIHKAYDAESRLELVNYTYIRKTTKSFGDTKVDNDSDKLTKLLDSNEPLIRKAVQSLHPALKKDKQVKDNPHYTNYIFARLGTLVLADLKDERAALDKL